jgi:hypothetical protein
MEKIRIRDGKFLIRDKHPGSATLFSTKDVTWKSWRGALMLRTSYTRTRPLVVPTATITPSNSKSRAVQGRSSVTFNTHFLHKKQGAVKKAWRKNILHIGLNGNTDNGFYPPYSNDRLPYITHRQCCGTVTIYSVVRFQLWKSFGSGFGSKSGTGSRPYLAVLHQQKMYKSCVFNVRIM